MLPQLLLLRGAQLLHHAACPQRHEQHLMGSRLVGQLVPDQGQAGLARACNKGASRTANQELCMVRHPYLVSLRCCFHSMSCLP